MSNPSSEIMTRLREQSFVRLGSSPNPSTPVSLFQVSGLDRTGKSTFLRKTLGLGEQFTHFPQPMLIKTPIATYHSLTEVMLTYTGHPAEINWFSKLAFWDRGLIDPYVYDGLRDTPTLTKDLWVRYYEESQRILGQTRQVFILSLGDPISDDHEDEEDEAYLEFADRLRARFLDAAEMIANHRHPCEILVVANCVDGVAHNWIADHARAGVLNGFGSDMQNGKIILGSEGGR